MALRQARDALPRHLNASGMQGGGGSESSTVVLLHKKSLESVQAELIVHSNTTTHSMVEKRTFQPDNSMQTVPEQGCRRRI